MTIERPGGTFPRPSAPETEELSRSTRTPEVGVPFGQKLANDPATEERGTAAVDRLQAILYPVANGVLVNSKPVGETGHVIGPIEFHQVRVDTPRPHGSTILIDEAADGRHADERAPAEFE